MDDTRHYLQEPEDHGEALHDVDLQRQRADEEFWSEWLSDDSGYLDWIATMDRYDWQHQDAHSGRG